MNSEVSLWHPTRRNWVWRLIQITLQVVFVVVLRYRARGLERLPAAGGGLILVNHQSFLDPMLVGLPLRRQVSYLARDSLFRVPVISWILRHTYVIPINRESASSASIKAAVSRIQSGFLVGIFPEGTRCADGEMGPFKPGFIALVRRSGLPVYPVGIDGAWLAMPRTSLFLRFAQVRVVVGDPLTVEELDQLTRKGNEQAFLAEAENRVRACQQEARRWRLRAPRNRVD